MDNLLIKVFCFLIISVIFSPLFSDEKCYSIAESHKRYIEKAQTLISAGNETGAVELYKKHLRCWKEKEVMLKLAKIYISRNDLYLAKLVYEEARAEKELKLVETILKNLDTHENKKKFMEQSIDIAEGIEKKAKEQKALAVTFLIAGTLSAGAGIGLFFDGKTFGGEDLKLAYYPLMFAGFSLLGGGITTNYSADYNKAVAGAYHDIAGNHYAVGATPSQYYEFSEKETETRKKMVKKLRIHGTSLLILSVPLFVISAFSIYDSYKWFSTGRPLSDDIGDAVILGIVAAGFTIAGELATVALGTGCIVGGITMIAYSNRWEKMEKPKSVIEFTGITPIINPVSKTYGLALGFSF